MTPRLVRGAAAALVLLGCGGGDGGGGGDTDAGPDEAIDAGGEGDQIISTAPGPTSGRLMVHVEESEGAAPIEGASIEITDVAPGLTNETGDIGFDLPVGRVMLRAFAVDHVAWIEERGISGRPGTLRIPLIERTPTVSVPTTGGTIVDDDVTVEFPDGAFAGDTDVSVTFLGPAETVRGSGPAQFRTDEDAMIHRMVSSVALSTSTPASGEYTVTFEAPAGPSYTLWRLEDDATWSSPLTPSASTDTTVSFTVTAPVFRLIFGDATDTATYALSEDLAEDDPQVFTINEAVGTVTATPPDGDPVELAPGDVIPEDSQIKVLGDGWVEITDPQGNVMEATDDTALTLSICKDAMCAPAVADLDLQRGYVRVKVQRLIESQKDKMRFRMHLPRRAVDGGVRGTVFDLEIPLCSNDERKLALVNVSEGTVVLDSHDTTVSAGNETTLCDGCPQGVEPSCTCLATDPQDFHTPPVSEFVILGSLIYNDEQYCPSTLTNAVCSLGDFTLSMAGAEVSSAGDADVTFTGNRCRSTWTQSPSGADINYQVETFVTPGGDVAADVTCNIIAVDGEGAAGGCLYKYTATP